MLPLWSRVLYAQLAFCCVLFTQLTYCLAARQLLLCAGYRNLSGLWCASWFSDAGVPIFSQETWRQVPWIWLLFLCQAIFMRRQPESGCVPCRCSETHTEEAWEWIWSALITFLPWVQVFCGFLFIVTTSLVGAIVSEIQGIAESATIKKRALEEKLDSYKSITPRCILQSFCSKVVHFCGVLWSSILLPSLSLQVRYEGYAEDSKLGAL